MDSSAKTFIFLDLEATGLNGDLPKITELCLVAVHVSALRNLPTDDSGEVQLPRVMDKLSLCVDPDKPVTSIASKITGLSNQLLSSCEKKKFDGTLMNTVMEFIERQAQPVCLVAHNGFSYDFPLLKTEVLQQQQDLSGSILCLDTLQAFRYLCKQDPEGAEYDGGSLKLSSIYQRFFGKEPNFSHHAEGDVLALLLVFIHKADSILKVANYKTWGEIRPMY